MANEKGFSLEEIYAGLKSFRGAMNDVATECNCNREWVRMVLTGKYTDDALVVKAAQVWLRYAEESAKQKQQISQLVNQARSFQNQPATV